MCFWLCCGSRKNRSEDIANKYSNLKRAALMTNTISGHPVNDQVHTKFISKLNQEKLKANVPEEIKKVLSPPLNSCSKITDNLFLTGIGGINEENIKEYNIKCIIQMAFEVPKFDVKGIECIRVPLEDSLEEDLSPYFDELTEKINEMDRKNIKTLVHCVVGASRSATIVIVYIMRFKKMSLREAFNYVKERRPQILPNSSFFQQMVNYEKKLYNKSSVNMIELKEEKIIVPDFYVQEYPELLKSEIYSIERNAGSKNANIMSITSKTM